MATSKASVAFMERSAIITTHRGQLGPVLATGMLKIHTIPLKPPLPVPSLLDADNGVPPPDRSQSEPWPWVVEN